jgi:hypothetical protein
MYGWPILSRATCTAGRTKGGINQRVRSPGSRAPEGRAQLARGPVTPARRVATFGRYGPHKSPPAEGTAADPAGVDAPADRAHSAADSSERPSDVLRRPTPGALYPWVKRASYIELGLFAALLLFWLLPGFEDETFVFGLSHGIGFIVLCLLVWIAVLRHEVPYTLLAATLTPAGPVGSVIAIEWMERRRQPNAEGSKTE